MDKPGVGIGAAALAGLWCVALLAGCATIKEGAKGFLGISTRVLDQNRGSAVVKEFNLDQPAAYAKVLKELSAISSVVYHKQAPAMVALYVSNADTTPVGIYISPAGAARAKVEVSSASAYAREYIAKRLFARIEGLDDPFEEKKGAAKEEASQVKKVEVLPQQEPVSSVSQEPAKPVLQETVNPPAQEPEKASPQASAGPASQEPAKPLEETK